jgi:hypothetical protein
VVAAPFTGAEASAALTPLATVFMVFGGIALMLRHGRFGARAIGLGVVVALFAGLAGQAFR